MPPPRFVATGGGARGPGNITAPALLRAGIAAGLVAVVAGFIGLRSVAGGAAAVLLVLFLLAPWAKEGRP
jgi:hypothetical protein